MTEDLTYKKGRKYDVKLVRNLDGRIRACLTVLCPDLTSEKELVQAVEIFKSVDDAKAVLSKRAQDLGYPNEAIDFGGT